MMYPMRGSPRFALRAPDMRRLPMQPQRRRLGLLLAVSLPLLSFLCAEKAEAAACAANTKNYRSAVATGNWAANATWQVFNGTAWVAAGCWPSSVDGSIEIQSGNNITVAAAITVDQVTIDAGGTVTVAAGQTWTINNGAGTDLTVNGTVVNSGTMTVTGAAVVFNSGATYQHSQNGGTIPTATWDPASTCLITGVTTTVPGGLTQGFGNFTWNSILTTGPALLSGALTTVHGNFTVLQTTATTSTCGGTNYRSLVLGSPGTGTTNTTTIDGNFIVSGYSSVNLNRGTAPGNTGTVVVNLGGNFDFEGGYFSSQDSNGGATTSTFNFTGASKTFYEAATNNGGGTGTGWLEFNCGIAVQSNVDFIVASGASLTMSSGLPLPVASTTDTNSLTVASGGTLNTGTNIVSGAGAFTLSSGGTLGIGSADGITSGTALTGNIQTTGTRSFDPGAIYVYNGTVAQNTGTGLPTTITGGLQINNSSGVTLTNSETVSGTLTLTSGALSLGSGANTLTASGTVNCSGGTITSTTGLVSYTGAALQNVCPGSYMGLTFSASTKTLNGAINIAGAFTPGVPTGNVVTGSTVSFNASGAQNIPAFNFNNLQTAGSGTKTLAGNVTTAGTITVGGGTTLNQGSSNLTTGTGGMVINSTGTFQDTGTGALTLNGNVANSGTFSVDGNGGGCKTTDAKATIQGTGQLTGGTVWLSDVSLTNTVTASPAVTAYDVTVVGAGRREAVSRSPARKAPAPARPRQYAWSASPRRLTATVCCSNGARPWKPTISASACTARPAMPLRRSRPI